jgi:protein-tyrosine phosphatase
VSLGNDARGQRADVSRGSLGDRAGGGGVRSIALEGCLNLRDLGGYAVADGRVVRWGCLYRSADLCSLTDADMGVIADLRLGVIVDLRNGDERAARPNRLPPGIEAIARETASQRSRMAEMLEDQIANGALPEVDDDYMTGVYVRHLDETLAPILRQILERSVDTPERPLLFHCAAGKDRTGLAAAVVLGVLGVDEATIVADYELTEQHWAVPRLAALADLLAEHRITEDEVQPFLSPRTEVFRRTLAHVDERWGGFEGYAVDHLGVDPSLPERLRVALLVAP